MLFGLALVFSSLARHLAEEMFNRFFAACMSLVYPPITKFIENHYYCLCGFKKALL